MPGVRCIAAPMPVLLVLFAACAGSGLPVGSAVPPAPDAWLVWSTDDQGTRTSWLDATGKVRGEADGIVIAYGNRLYRIAEATRVVQLSSCGPADVGDRDTESAAEEPSTGTLTGLELVGLDGSSSLVVSAPPAQDEHDAEFEFRASIVAGLGPYLFVSEVSHRDGCGVPAVAVVAARIFDLGQGKDIELIDETSLADEQKTAWAQLASEARPEDASTLPQPTDLGRGASVPVWKDGRLTFLHQFVVEDCYTCSDGDWSSHTRSTWVVDETLPLAVATLPAVPPAVVAWLSAHHETPSGVSWGTAAADWSQALRGR